MGGHYEHYEYCERCIAQTAAVLQDLCKGRAADAAAIRRRRQKDRIALKALYDALRRAFLTPIDREDLWTMCVAAERVLFFAEDTALNTHSLGNEERWVPLYDVCRLLRRATAAFPHFQREELFFEKADELQGKLAVLQVDPTAQPLLTACDTFVNLLLTAALKNE